MNILLKLYDCYSPYNRALFADFAPELARRGDTVVVAARSFHGLRAPAAVTAYRVGLGRRMGWLDFAFVGWQLARLCRHHAIDVVHVVPAPQQRGLWDYLSLAVFRLLSRTPVVVGHHYAPGSLRSRLLASFSWTAERLVVPGTPMKEEMRSRYPGLEAKMRPALNAVSGPPRPYLLSLSRVAREKGIDVLLLAFAGLLQSGHDVDLAICGTLPSLLGIRIDRYQRLAARLGLAGRVHFWGHLEPPQAAQLLQGCLAFVLASRWEGHSFAILEAMAAGKPVVATRVGAAGDTIRDGLDGILVAPQDAGALQEGLDRLLRDESLRQRLGQAARERALRDFSWSAHARTWEEIYREALRP